MPFIASGSYGCVFRPALKCVERTSIGTRSVGKVFQDEGGFETEKGVMDTVKRIDPNGDFTIAASGSCTVNPNKYRPKDDVSKCPIINPENPNKQLIMKYGGKSLDMLVFDKTITKAAFVKLLKLMHPIFKGLLAFQTHGVIHQDIKPDNIMYDGKKLYLIDFGIMSQAATHYKNPKKNHMLNADYPYFPPEYKCMYYLNKSVDHVISKYLDNFVFSIHIAGKVVNLPVAIQKYLGLDIDEEVRAMFGKMKKAAAISPQVVDVYQLGLSIFMMWLAVRGGPPNIHGIKDMLRCMIHPNVYERCDPKSALQYYESVMSASSF